MRSRPTKIVALIAALAAVAYGGATIASAAGNGSGTSSGARTLDDGKGLASQATIGIDRAVGAAQSAASGAIGEIDLEHVDGRLVYNVDVGPDDVKVDAGNSTVVRVDRDD